MVNISSKETEWTFKRQGVCSDRVNKCIPGNARLAEGFTCREEMQSDTADGALPWGF